MSKVTKVLIISFRFSPFNSIGTNRIIALVEHLKSENIDYRVVTSYEGEHGNRNFIADENVIYIPWYNLKKLKRIASNNYKKRDNQKKELKETTALRKVSNSIKQFLGFFLYPDPYLSWVLSALGERKEILKNYEPDIIYSSSYPYSSHLLAYFFVKKTKARWFAELRDPWVNNHLRKPNWKIISLFDNYLSKKLFRRANTIVTVSKVWKNEMSTLYKKRVLLIRNGFIRTLETSIDDSIVRIYKNSNKKKILYTGSIFPNFQNIEAFICAYMSDNNLRDEYDFVYVGSNGDLIQQILNKYDYSRDGIILVDKVSSDTALWMQNNSDVLLLLNWKDKRVSSKGIIPGKFYEYLGANKPIILWNESINNELYELSIEINNFHKGDKILVMNDDDLFQKLGDFNYDSEMSKIENFSRESQFRMLIENFQKEKMNKNTNL